METFCSTVVFSKKKKKKLWADQDWIGLMIFKNFAEQDWIGFNFIGPGWTRTEKFHGPLISALQCMTRLV